MSAPGDEILIAAAAEGAVFAVVKAAAQGAGAQPTGHWPTGH